MSNRARSRSMHPPSRPFIDGAERVTTLMVLGVLLNARLTMTDHVSQVLNTCSSSMFALRLLLIHGFQPQELSPLHPFCMQLRRGGGLRAKEPSTLGTAHNATKGLPAFRLSEY